MNFESLDPDKLNLSECEFNPQKRKELKKKLLDLMQEGHDLIKRSEEKLKKEPQVQNDTKTDESEMVFIEIEPPDDLEEDQLVDYLDSHNTEIVSTELPNKTIKESNDSSSDDTEHEKEIGRIFYKIGRTDYTCDLCKRHKFGCVKELNNHIFKKHPSIAKFQCQECTKIFFSKFLLFSHVKERHPQMRCFLCESIVFFKTMNYLNDHLKKIHNGENNNICRICKKVFKNYYILKAHEPTHDKDFKAICKYCGRMFKHQNLETHYKIHRNERNHKCDMCESSFIGKGDLIVHTRLHTGERPYKCKICNENFIANTNLNKHMKSRHKDSFKVCN